MLVSATSHSIKEVRQAHTNSFVAKARISLMARGARFLKATPWTCSSMYQTIALVSVFRPMPAIRHTLWRVLCRQHGHLWTSSN